MSKYLEQLFFDGIAVKEDEIKYGKKTCPYKLSTVSFQSQQQIDQMMADMDKDSTALQASHSYVFEVLCHTLLEFNGLLFESYEERKTYLLSRSATLVTTLGKFQGQFENEVRALITNDAVDETFSQAPSTLEESKPS